MKIWHKLMTSQSKNTRAKRRGKRNARPLGAEALESRRLLHGEWLTSDGTLHIEGTPFRDEYQLIVESGWKLTVRHRAPEHPNAAERKYHSREFNLANGSVRSIRFWGDAGNDDFVHDGQPSTTAFLPPMRLDGGPGEDRLYGGDRADVILGGEGGDRVLRGYGGNDIIDGGAGNDELRGDSGNYAYFGNDFLCGGTGQDILIGDRGGDRLYGGGLGEVDMLNTGSDPGDYATQGACPTLHGIGDFDGDNRGDFVVWRGNGVWYQANSLNGATRAVQWGLPGDVPAPADYDADGRVDRAVFRPSDNRWYVQTQAGQVYTMAWGHSLLGDIPVPADYNGDGRDEIAVYRAADQTWWSQDVVSGAVTNGGFRFGQHGDIPVPADYNGDGKTDLAVYRPGNATWWVMDAGTRGWIAFGQRAGTPAAGDIPVAADFSGDGKADFAVWNSHTGVWKYRDSRTGGYHEFQWGLPGDSPQPSDFDGDGRADWAVFRPSNGTWYVNSTFSGAVTETQWGLSGDWAIHDRTQYARSVVAPHLLRSSGTERAASLPTNSTSTDDSLPAVAVEPLLRQAMDLWREAHRGEDIEVSVEDVELKVTDFPSGYLALTEGHVIYLDSSADGFGWFIDSTPTDSSEFQLAGDDGWVATSGPAHGKIDMLTVLVHELGHVLGHEHVEAAGDPMQEELAPGIRRLPSSKEAPLLLDGHQQRLYLESLPMSMPPDPRSAMRRPAGNSLVSERDVPTRLAHAHITRPLPSGVTEEHEVWEIRGARSRAVRDSFQSFCQDLDAVLAEARDLDDWLWSGNFVGP